MIWEQFKQCLIKHKSYENFGPNYEIFWWESSEKFRPTLPLGQPILTLGHKFIVISEKWDPSLCPTPGHPLSPPYWDLWAYAYDSMPVCLCAYMLMKYWERGKQILVSTHSTSRRWESKTLIVFSSE